MATKWSVKDDRQVKKAAAGFDMMADPVLVIDRQGRLSYANPAAEALMGSALVGEGVWERLPWLDTPTVRAAVERALVGDGPQTGEAWGSLPYEVRLSPSAIGAVMLLVGRRPGWPPEPDVRQWMERLYRVFANSPTLVYTADRDLRYTWFLNARHGFDADQVVGQRDDELLPPDDVAELIELKQWVIDHGRGIRRVVPVTVGRDLFFYDVSAQPLRDDGGTVSGVAVAATDVTELRHAEQQLEALAESLERHVAARTAALEKRTEEVRTLAAALTLAEQRERRRIAQFLHDDLQQMLYGLQLKLQLLRMEVQTGDLPAAVEHVGTLDRLIRRAIDATRSLAVELSPPALRHEELKPALEWLAGQMEQAHGLRVRVVAEAPCLLPAEDLRILVYQIARELLFNVVKHAGVAEAELRMWPEEDRVLVQIRDYGTGFDVARAVEHDHLGGSLGLFSIRQRLDLVGGGIEIESWPSEGTCVTIAVPNLHGAPPECVPAGAPLRVLLVEDDPLIREAYGSLFEIEPDIMVCGEAPTAMRALELLDTIGADVVVVDLSLPDLQGLELVRRLVARHPAVRVLVVSGHEAATHAADALAAGAAAYLDKRDAAIRLIPTLRAVASKPAGVAG